MLKEKIFKTLFPEKAQQITDLQSVGSRIEELERVERERPSMREELGLPFLDFSSADVDTSKPPHYLDGLDDASRKSYISHMETIYADKKFHEVINYVINLVANHSMFVSPEEKMRNGRMAIIGVRHVVEEFENAHKEFLESKNKDEDFDPLEITPA